MHKVIYIIIMALHQRTRALAHLRIRTELCCCCCCCCCFRIVSKQMPKWFGIHTHSAIEYYVLIRSKDNKSQRQSKQINISRKQYVDYKFYWNVTGVRILYAIHIGRDAQMSQQFIEFLQTFAKFLYQNRAGFPSIRSQYFQLCGL